METRTPRTVWSSHDWTEDTIIYTSLPICFVSFWSKYWFIHFPWQKLQPSQQQGLNVCFMFVSYAVQGRAIFPWWEQVENSVIGFPGWYFSNFILYILNTLWKTAFKQSPLDIRSFFYLQPESRNLLCSTTVYLRHFGGFHRHCDCPEYRKIFAENSALTIHTLT